MKNLNKYKLQKRLIVATSITIPSIAATALISTSQNNKIPAITPTSTPESTEGLYVSVEFFGLNSYKISSIDPATPNSGWVFSPIDDTSCWLLGMTHDHWGDEVVNIPEYCEWTDETGVKHTYAVYGLFSGNSFDRFYNSKSSYVPGFHKMPNLRQINWPANCSKIKEIKTSWYNNRTEAHDSTYYGMFEDCPNLTEITIPSSVVKITGSFRNSNIETIHFTPDNPCEISDYSFYNMGRLNNLNITANWIFKGNYIFANDKFDTITFSDDCNFKNIPPYCFQGNKFLQTINLPDSIETISEHAFDSTGLTSFDFPSPIVSIGDSAFLNNVELVNLDFSDTPNFETIGVSAFQGCSKLAEIIGLDSSGLQNILDNSFKNTIALANFAFQDLRNLKKIGNSAFDGSGLTNITFNATNANDISIGEYAFARCASLDTINGSNSHITTIPYGCFYASGLKHFIFDNSDLTLLDSCSLGGTGDLQTISATNSNLTKIGNGLVLWGTYNAERFYDSGVSNLVSVDFTGSPLETIGAAAFAYSENLETVKLPNSLKNIEYSAFFSCSKLINITDIFSNVEVIGAQAFMNSALSQEIVTGSNLKSIGASAFQSTNIPSVTLSTTNTDVVDIGDSAFHFCKSLKQVIIDAPVKVIPSGCFYEDTALEKVKLPDNPFIIDDSYAANRFGAFENVGLKELINEENCTYIGNRAFTNVRPLDEFNFGNNITKIGDSAFYNVLLCNEVILPETLLTLNSNAFNGTTIPKVTFNNCKISSIDPSAFNSCKSLTNVVGLDTCKNLKTIDGSAFTSCEKLENISFPESLTTIGTGAFSSCFLLNISGPIPLLENINSSAFRNCRNLERFDIPASAPLKTIDSFVFNGCSSLQRFSCPSAVETIKTSAFKDCTSMSQLKLNNNLKTIQTESFMGCTSLEQVIIPRTVTTLENSCFKNCSSLTDMIFDSLDNIKTIPQGFAENNTNLLRIELPHTVTSIGNAAFKKSGIASCNLEELTNINSIGQSAFEESLLEKVVIPNTITSIGQNCFNKLTNLISLEFENNSQLRVIPQYFVSDNLQYKANIQLPDSITTLSNNAFGSANKYEFENGTAFTTIGVNTFHQSANYVYNFPGTQLEIKNLISISDNNTEHERAVTEFTFAENSTVTTLWDSFLKVEESIEFPDSLKYWYKSRIPSSYGYFNGNSLDLKNIEYIGTYANGISSEANICTGEMYLFSAPNLIPDNFNAPKLTYLQGLAELNGRTINYKEKTPNLKYFNGGYDSQEKDMRTWLPDNMLKVVGACSNNFINASTEYIFPITTAYAFPIDFVYPAQGIFYLSEKTTYLEKVQMSSIPNYGLYYMRESFNRASYEFLSHEGNAHKLNIVLPDTSIFTLENSGINNDTITNATNGSSTVDIYSSDNKTSDLTSEKETIIHGYFSPLLFYILKKVIYKLQCKIACQELT